MQTTSALYQSLRANGAATTWRIVVNDGDVLPASAIFDGTINGALFATESPGVGGCTSRELNLTIVPGEIEIPRMAKMSVELAYVDGVDQSEWLPVGTFFVDTRSWDAQHEMLTLHAYDAMLKGESQFILSGADSGTWPRAQLEIVDEIAARLGVEVDARCKINDSYTAEYPSDYTMREMLSFIAASHCGNWIITPANTLYLVPLVPTGETIAITNLYDMESSPAFDAFSGVQFYHDGVDLFAAGDETGRLLEIDCPWATQDMADNCYLAIMGYAYQPYDATDAEIDPAAEIGDAVSILGLESIIAEQTVTLGAADVSDISAPGDEEIDHEYPYENPTQKATKRALAKAESAIKVSLKGIESRVESAEGNITVLQQTAGQVNLRVTTSDGTLTTAITPTQWQAIYSTLAGETGSGFYFDFALGRFVYDGTGVFRSTDGESYIEVDNDSFVLYAMNSSGSYVEKVRIGFVSSETTDYPYIQLGAGTSSGGNAGLVKKFTNGIFVGNSAAKDATGSFSPTADYAGIFINTSTGITYVVQGTSMQNVYTGEAIAKFA